MQINMGLDIERYKSIKENAYCFSLMLDKDKLISFAQMQQFSSEEEKNIYINTLLYPNDLEIIEAMISKLNEKNISEKIGIPISIIKAKAEEYIRYRTWDVLKQNQVLKHLSSQLSGMETFQSDSILKKLK